MHTYGYNPRTFHPGDGVARTVHHSEVVSAEGGEPQEFGAEGWSCRTSHHSSLTQRLCQPKVASHTRALLGALYHSPHGED